jgi:hypothetical protein
MSERIRAAIRLLYPDDMTPTAKRILEKILDEEDHEAAADAGAFVLPREGEIMTKSASIQVWTTENSDAIAWGTHDTEAAKRVYASQGFDSEPDWDDVRLMWAAPHLIDLEQWDAADYGNEPKDGWVPYAVYGF